MKDKILLFIIGLLVGSIISTASFFVYTKSIVTTNTNNQDIRMRGQMMGGQMNQGQPPQDFNGNNNQVPNNDNSNN